MQFAVLWILVLLQASVERLVADRPSFLILLANLIVPTVQVMPLTVLLAVTLVHQLLFPALCLGIIGVLWHQTDARQA